VDKWEFAYVLLISIFGVLFETLFFKVREEISFLGLSFLPKRKSYVALTKKRLNLGRN